MFKRRCLNYQVSKMRINFGNISVFILKPIRYELVYIRFLKKLVRRKHIKKKSRFTRRKFWVYLKVNYILTAKTTNARMGAGIGSVVRLASRITAYRAIIELRNYSKVWCYKMYRHLRYRYPFQLMYLIKRVR